MIGKDSICNKHDVYKEFTSNGQIKFPDSMIKLVNGCQIPPNHQSFQNRYCPKIQIRIQRLTEMVIGHLKNPRTNDQIGQWMPNSTQSSVLSQAKSLIIGEMADNFRAAQVIYYTSEPKQQAA